jgi:hypothetical protein
LFVLDSWHIYLQLENTAKIGQEKEADDVEKFASYVATKFRKMPEDRRDDAEHAVMQALRQFY